MLFKYLVLGSINISGQLQSNLKLFAMLSFSKGQKRRISATYASIQCYGYDGSHISCVAHLDLCLVSCITFASNIFVFMAVQ